MQNTVFRVILVICCLFPLVRAQAQLETNLVVNGGFEAGPSSADGSVVASIPGWVTTGNATVVKYGPGFADPGAFLHGSNFLAGGPAPGLISAATQKIDVSRNYGFNRGGVTFTVSAYLGSFLGQGSQPTLYVYFIDASGAVKKSLFLNNRSSPYQFFGSQSGVVPAGTTQIVLDIRMTGGVSYDDAYADNVSLVLHAPKLNPFASGQPQIALSNSQTQQVALWTLNGENVASGALVDTTLPADWQVVGAGDFGAIYDAAARTFISSTLVLQNSSTGEVGFWYINGARLVTGGYAAAYPPDLSQTGRATLPSGWRVSGIGDIDGDGFNDLVLYNPTTQQVAFWYMSGTAVVNGAYATMRDGSIATLPEGWEVAGAADIDGDGNVDIVLQNVTTGQVAVWFMNNNLVTAGALASETLPPGWQIAGNGDYNGDGITDLVLQNPSTNEEAFWYLGGVTVGTDQLPNSVKVMGGALIDLDRPAGWSIAGPR